MVASVSRRRPRSGSNILLGLRVSDRSKCHVVMAEFIPTSLVLIVTLRLFCEMTLENETVFAIALTLVVLYQQRRG